MELKNFIVDIKLLQTWFDVDVIIVSLQEQRYLLTLQ